MSSPRSARRPAVLAVVGSLVAANGIRPFHRRARFAAVPIAAAGLLASEAPLLCAVAQLGAGLTAARRLRGRARWTMVAITIGSCAALIRLQRAAQEAAPALDRAIEQSLDSAPPPEHLPGVAVRPALPPTPLLLLRRRYTSAATSAIAYTEGSHRHRLDIWSRPDLSATRRAPVLLQVHGGGWSTGGNRTQGLPLMAHMAEAGWVCVAPRYRLSPSARWPDQIVDVLRVIAWTKANIDRFGGDPSFVAITGGSAGGHLAALAALAAGHPTFQPGFETIDTRVQAAVPIYGAYDWLDRDHTGSPSTQWFLERVVVQQSVQRAPEIFDEASPRSWIRPDAPPFFIIHGTHDALLPVEQARSFATALRSVSHNPVASAEVPFGQHSFDLFRTARGRATAHAVHRFLHSVFVNRD